jgi:hypothetical protein
LNVLLKVIFYTWTSPNSLIGSLLGLIGLLTGGRVQVREGCLEFFGGFVSRLLERLGSQGVAAMTLGHTILGQDRETLDIVRSHEQIHVTQYEKWGVLFIPVYLGCSAYLWLAGKDCYRDNPFEQQAFREEAPRIKN